MLTARILVWRSLRYYWRTHLSVLAGAVVSTAILVGALVVGDSVRFSLQRLALMRLGQVRYALSAGDRFFRSRLADDLAPIFESVTAANLQPTMSQASPVGGVATAPVVQLRGIGIGEGGGRRANQVQILGGDSRFWAMAPTRPDFAPPAAEEAVINRALANRLGAKPNDVILLRVEKAGRLPYDAPLAPDNNLSIPLRVTVKAIAADEQFGRFSLQSNQRAPLNAFLSAEWLGRKLDLVDRANTLLVKDDRPGHLNDAGLREALRPAWRLADAGLELRELPGLPAAELRSDRVFLEPAVVESMREFMPQAQGVFTYFVNELRAGDRTTPYSFVSAPGPPLVPPGMTDHDIVVNQWLADDLGVRAGDPIDLAYFVLGPTRALEVKTNSFRVRSVVSLAGPAADRELMPRFPGLADAANCRDWNPGIPIDLNKIRKKDEDYWSQYRGTPKAFITLAAAQQMWSNRFGSLTAIRFAHPDRNTAALANEIARRLPPSAFGLALRPVRQEGLQAGSASVDFGQLFLGLSFFIIAAALLLMGLLFIFNIEQRAEETGILLALGWPIPLIRRLLLTEGALLAVLGGLLGVGGGILYNHAILYALSSIWRSAVGDSMLRFHAEPLSVLLGLAAGIGVAVAVMWLAIRRQTSRSLRLPPEAGRGAPSMAPRKIPASAGLAFVCVIAVLIIFSQVSPGRGKEAAAAFFSAGTLSLVAGLAVCHAFLAGLGRTRTATHLRLVNLSWRNCGRRRGRSLATIALLACGIFLVVAVAANRPNALSDAARRDSGTGGFALYGETSLPVLFDFQSRPQMSKLGFETNRSDDLQFVPLRVRAGDDASCLNLNRVQQPPLLAVRPGELDRHGSFTFASLSPGADRRHPWLALNQPIDADTVPAIADQTVIDWSLGKALGDTISFTDEQGRSFKLKLVGGLANSILQGSLLISETAFLERYPSVSGYRAFLVDAPPAAVAAVAQKLSFAWQDLGLDIQPAAQRLAEFNVVEDTYLSIFLVLGGLGMVLGSVGLAIVVLRNVLERRGELAMLRAVGFDRRLLHRFLLYEHGLLLGAGFSCGAGAALVAILPAIIAPGGHIPWATVAVLLPAIVLTGAAATLIATVMAVRGDLLPPLRGE